MRALAPTAPFEGIVKTMFFKDLQQAKRIVQGRSEMFEEPGKTSLDKWS